MRKDVLVAVFGFLIGAATLAGGGEDDDWLLRDRLEKLRRAAGQALRGSPRAPHELPVIGASGNRIEFFPVADLTAARIEYYPPVHRLVDDDSGPAFSTGPSEEAIQPYGTLEEVMELVRTSCSPRTWEENAARIAASGHFLLAANGRAVLEQVQAFLDERLRAPAHRCVTVEAEAIDMKRPLYRSLLGGDKAALTREARGRIEAALAAGDARLVFSARTTGFVGQRVLIWHGRQIAVMTDATVVTANGVSSADPKVAVVQAGGFISVLPSVGDDPTRITLDLELRFDDLDGPIETRPGEHGVPIDLPRIDAAGATVSITVPDATWAIAGGGMRAGDTVRVLLVRATHLARKEAAK